MPLVQWDRDNLHFPHFYRHQQILIYLNVNFGNENHILSYAFEPVSIKEKASLIIFSALGDEKPLLLVALVMRNKYINYLEWRYCCWPKAAKWPPCIGC